VKPKRRRSRLNSTAGSAWCTERAVAMDELRAPSRPLHWLSQYATSGSGPRCAWRGAAERIDGAPESRRLEPLCAEGAGLDGFRGGR